MGRRNAEAVKASIRPLVEEYFAWIKDFFRQGLVLAKSETAKGLAYSINQEENGAYCYRRA